MALTGLVITLGTLLSGIHCCVNPDDFLGAKSHGDIIIGGLFAVHGKMMSSASGYPKKPAIQNCAGFELQGFVQMLAMSHTMEMLNNSSFIPGIKLGYEIYDTCSEPTLAMAATMKFLSSYNSTYDILKFSCNYTNHTPKVKAIIGASYSEVSIAVSRLLNIQLIPLVSHSSSAEILSDKLRFPAFVRTISNDAYQTRAMAKLIYKSGWNWIGIIAMDDDYGRSAVQSFGAQSMDINICIAFKEFIPSHLSDTTVQLKIDETVKKILKETRVNVIVSFLKPTLVTKLFEQVIEKKIQKTWIASDSWAAATLISSIPNIYTVGPVIGFLFKSGDTTSFTNYLKDLNPQHFEMNRLLDQYSELLYDCQDMKQNELYNCISDSSKETVFGIKRRIKLLRKDFLSATVHPGFVYSTQLAVIAIAHAIRDICVNRNCTNPTAFAPWELLQSIKTVNFTFGGKNIYFDSSGDANTGYDVLIWKKGSNGNINLTYIAEYDSQNDKFTFKNKEKEAEFRHLKKIQSRCSDQCKPGEMKKTSTSLHTCCYECVPCPENHYSNKPDMGFCIPCENKTYWAPAGSAMCRQKKIQYLRWNDGFAIVLLIISFLGIILIFAIAILFTKNFDTPVVKASGGTLCYVILFFIFSSFVSAAFFIGKPEDFKCKVRQTLFGVSFTVVVACILLKSIKILLAFSFEPRIQSFLKCLYKPITLVCTCTGIQVTICTLWLLFWSPHIKMNFSLHQTIILECDEGSAVAFGVMLGYIAVLAFICFIFAFKCRKLPENYNEAKFITFGMLIYFIAWITFIPVYATTFGIYLPAVEMIVILISSYGILTCTFLPKCYIMVYKQDTNTKTAFLNMIYKYSSKSAGSLAVSHISVSSIDSGAPISDIHPVSSVSCISNSFSFQERLVAAEITSRYTSHTRRRLSSI
ncbi:G-protein coupled receptor family C group 6 member A-like [Bombina bombina]|uniref:G-protein coupled receptor family C group 6 member A-like n=1 Tax=Bombina bombina TaxID=8345 RepID=UPI00235AC4ED|nr:G-protein coupled receptor family C group 6 member A-like [Bombina bombina]